MSTQDTNDPQIAALVASVTARYELTDEQIKQLADAIAQGRLAEMQSTVEDALNFLEIDDSFELPTDIINAQEDAAKKNAAGIAATYKHDMQNAAIAFVVLYIKQHGSDAGVTQSLRAYLVEWCANRLAWKADQIAQYETLAAHNTAMRSMIDALLNGDLEIDSDALAEVQVAVVPDDAGEPFCQEYAGQTYTLSEALDLPDFPAHPNCIHYIIFV